MFCDNEGLVKNTTRVESSLNKKDSVIAYHFIRWNVAAGVISIAWISGELNIADAMRQQGCLRTREISCLEIGPTSY